MNNNNKPAEVDLKKLFNLNNILSQVIQFAAYIIAILSATVLVYLSFIDTLNIEVDWTTLGVFSGTTCLLAWLNWTTFYKRQYEKLMAEDIVQNAKGEYSIHGRYYMAIKDWTDRELQDKIDDFNTDYTNKWIRWVEKKTGCPINTCTMEELDNKGKPILDENGEPKLVKNNWY